ncbi:peptidylprolyl isomerase [Candidatus Bathyarchaeota archaeon]|nr:peptidylprolyl isomerase [Candidatus Bathyarchaeota archaeon]
MAVKKGDFILIDYIGKIKETGETFDTTIEDIAKKERIYRKDANYEPVLVVVGEGWVVKGLDEGLINLELEKPTTIEIQPEKGFGMRDPNKVKLVPIRRFREQGITPYPGLRVELEGKLALVRTVGAGRVQVDFNPPLAGKTLIYEVTLKKILEGMEEKIRALIHRRIQAIDSQKFGLNLTEKTVTIEVPEEAFFIDGLQYAKRGIAIEVQKFFPEIENIVFIETFKKRELTSTATPTTAAPTQESASEQPQPVAEKQDK